MPPTAINNLGAASNQLSIITLSVIVLQSFSCQNHNNVDYSTYYTENVTAENVTVVKRGNQPPHNKRNIIHSISPPQCHR